MKHSNAVKHLRAMLWTLQRMCSITREELTAGDWKPEVVQGVLEDLLPWVHSNKCPVNVLVKVLDNAEDGKRMDPLFFYNMVYVATSLEPTIEVCIGFFSQDKTFPEHTDINWLKGWEPE